MGVLPSVVPSSLVVTQSLLIWSVSSDSTHSAMNTWILSLTICIKEKQGTILHQWASLTMVMVDTCKEVDPTMTGTCKLTTLHPSFDYSFNIAKRVYKNDLEHITTIVPLSLFNGLINPFPTIGFLLTYFLGRQLYTFGYFEKEGANNQKRMLGSLLCNISHVGILGLTIVSAVSLRKGRVIAQLLPK